MMAPTKFFFSNQRFLSRMTSKLWVVINCSRCLINWEKSVHQLPSINNPLFSWLEKSQQQPMTNFSHKTWEMFSKFSWVNDVSGARPAGKHIWSTESKRLEELLTVRLTLNSFPLDILRFRAKTIPQIKGKWKGVPNWVPHGEQD